MTKSPNHSLNSFVNLRWAALGVLVLASTALMAQASNQTSGKQPIKVVSKSRAELNTQANQMASGIRAAEAALTPAELAIAQRVEVGLVQCELGASVTVVADSKMPGYFDVHGKKFRFRMVPVVTSTGAIRLEDAKAGAVWLQLANKSMLMNQKLGSRLADACMSPTQMAVSSAMEKSPPPSLLDAPIAVRQTVLPVDSSPVIAIQ